LNEEIKEGSKLLEIGEAYSSSDIKIKIDPVKLLSRHCAVIGSTGSGKSCSVTVLINELIKNKIDIPIFIFDVNGEYTWAFKNFNENIQILKFGGEIEDKNLIDDISKKDNFFIQQNIKVNYTSFTRRTWRNILKPSERTQIPALNYAVDVLKYLPASLNEINNGLKIKGLENKYNQYIPTDLKNNPNKYIRDYLCGDPSESDSQKLHDAYNIVRFLFILSSLELDVKTAQSLPMRYLSRAITDRWAIRPNRNNNYEMHAFSYQNISSLCDRITELCRDPLFNIFCNTSGCSGFNLSETLNTNILVTGENKNISLTIFDLSSIPQEYLPIFVNSLLEHHLIEALNGKFKKKPHILVLDEAHHYLGERGSSDNENIYLGNSPGDRISKEGRKFGLHLIISTQRPRELSPTIVAQLGTVISHSLTNDSDRQIINAFGSYSDRTILDELSILPRREAIIIGQAISMPLRLKINFLDIEYRPHSKDPLEELI